MKTIPMLFSAPMIKALLDGRKTQTRRIVSPHLPSNAEWRGWVIESSNRKQEGCGSWTTQSGDTFYAKPKYKAGDLIWVKETFRLFDASDECDHCDFPCPCPATGEPIYRATHDDGESTWKPSIYMPRWASRITLKVTRVRAERLQDITTSDSLAEGIKPADDEFLNTLRIKQPDPRRSYQRLWEQINGGGSWDANPWVWVIEFEVINKNIDAYLRDHGGEA